MSQTQWDEVVPLIELREQDIGISQREVRLDIPHPVLGVADFGAYFVYNTPDAGAKTAHALVTELLQCPGQAGRGVIYEEFVGSNRHWPSMKSLKLSLTPGAVATDGQLIEVDAIHAIVGYHFTDFLIHEFPIRRVVADIVMPSARLPVHRWPHKLPTGMLPQNAFHSTCGGSQPPRDEVEIILSAETSQLADQIHIAQTLVFRRDLTVPERISTYHYAECQRICVNVDGFLYDPLGILRCQILPVANPIVEDSWMLIPCHVIILPLV
jgi:hypothetical protein